MSSGCINMTFLYFLLYSLLYVCYPESYAELVSVLVKCPVFICALTERFLNNFLDDDSDLFREKTKKIISGASEDKDHKEFWYCKRSIHCRYGISENATRGRFREDCSRRVLFWKSYCTEHGTSA